MRWRQFTTSAYQEPPSARMGHVAVLVDATGSWGEELLIVHGGLNAEKQPLGDLAVLQTASGAWFHPSTTNAGPHARAFHSAVAVGSLFYIFGGHVFLKETKGLHKFNDLWCLNTDNWEWTPVQVQLGSPQPVPRDFLGMVHLPGRRVLLFGGLDGAEKRLDDTWIFNCETSMWLELQLPLPKPKPRYAHALARVDQRILLCGGESNTGLLNDLWILKGVVTLGEEKQVWVPLELPGTAPSPRKAHALAALGWHVFVMGGHTSETGWFARKTDLYHNDVVVMDRQGTVQWRTPSLEGELPAAREYHTLTPVSGTQLLLFGGGNGKVIFGDSWWLCLEDNTGMQPPLEQLSAAADQGFALSDQGRQPAGDTAMAASERAHSTMSDISVDRSLLGSTELGHLRGVGTASGDASTSHSEPADSPWWTGSLAATRFASLHQTLQIPHQPASLHLDALEKSIFQQLGQQIWQEQPSEEGLGGLLEAESILQRAARGYLLKCTSQELRIREICALLWDYKQIRLKVLEATTLSALGQALKERQKAGNRRFCHMQAKDLQLRDVGALHAEYKRLISNLE